MTVKNAIEKIDNLISKKKEILKAEKNLLKTIDKRKKNSIKITVTAVISAIQYDIKSLQSIKRQLKPKSKKQLIEFIKILAPD